MKRGRSRGDGLTIDALRRHLQQKPQDGQAWLGLAQVLTEQPPGPDLSHAIGRSLQLLPDSHQAWFLAAKLQERARGAEAAFQFLEQAAARNPGLAAPLLALARVRQGRFQLVEALAAVDRAIERSGETADTLNTRGDINLQGTHWDEALADFRRVEKAGANDANLMYRIGCCHFGLDDHPAAEAHFRKALKRDPRHDRSRLTLAFSYIKRLESAKGEATLAEVVRVPGGDPQVRHKAATALAVLAERRRLEPVLQHALQDADVGPLQVALDATPDVLLRRDEATAERFRRLASIFCNHSFDVELPDSPDDADFHAFLEAETLCTAEIDSETLTALYQRLTGPQPDDGTADQGLLETWQAVRDRAGFDPGVLQGANGEAWLRYWHARLLKRSPEAFPGQFKAADAAILGKPQISPEYLAYLCQVVLRELLPDVPAGMARALFLYVGLKVLQPFSDGNSRLARFLLNAELEAFGLPAVVIPVSWSGRMNGALDAVLFEGRIEPLFQSLVSCYSHQSSLLTESGRTAS